MPLCDALPAPAWQGRQGAEAALLSRGTTVPLSPTKALSRGDRGQAPENSKQCVYPEGPTVKLTPCTYSNLLNPCAALLLVYDQRPLLMGFLTIK